MIQATDKFQWPEFIKNNFEFIPPDTNGLCQYKKYLTKSKSKEFIIYFKPAIMWDNNDYATPYYVMSFQYINHLNIKFNAAIQPRIIYNTYELYNSVTALIKPKQNDTGRDYWTNL
jgi:hypothetical protein